MTIVALAPLDLAALLCSRVCHDVISPVGAIVNGLEVLEDEEDPEMRDVAIDLIKQSAAWASAQLQFCRLAFGAAGSVGASVDTGDAESVARGLFDTEKTTLAWNPTRQFCPRTRSSCCSTCARSPSRPSRAAASSRSISTGQDETLAPREPRGPTPGSPRFRRPRRRPAGGGAVDAHSIQPYFAGLVACECGMKIEVEQGPEDFAFHARPWLGGGRNARASSRRLNATLTPGSPAARGARRKRRTRAPS